MVVASVLLVCVLAAAAVRSAETDFVRLVDEATVYLRVTGAADGADGAFKPTVDDFSQLDLEGSGERFKDQENVDVQLAIGDIVSKKRAYKKDDADKYVPTFSAVVNMDMGNVTSIVWDDSCKQCSDDDCIDEKTCGVDNDSCDDKCDIRIYLVWSGKDKNGVYSTSRSFLPSQFQAFSVNPVYKAGASLTTEHYV